jgi:hypothetical protein
MFWMLGPVLGRDHGCDLNLPIKEAHPRAVAAAA